MRDLFTAIYDSEAVIHKLEARKSLKLQFSCPNFTLKLYHVCTCLFIQKIFIKIDKINMFCCKFVKSFPFNPKKFDKAFSEFYNKRRNRYISPAVEMPVLICGVMIDKI